MGCSFIYVLALILSQNSISEANDKAKNKNEK